MNQKEFLIINIPMKLFRNIKNSLQINLKYQIKLELNQINDLNTYNIYI